RGRGPGDCVEGRGRGLRAGGSRPAVRPYRAHASRPGRPRGDDPPHRSVRAHQPRGLLRGHVVHPGRDGRDPDPPRQQVAEPQAPNTGTDAPGSTFAVLMPAPTPVITPQPTRQALSSGASLRIFTHPVSGMTVSSAKDPTQCGMSMPEPFTLKRGAPSYVPPII